MSTKYHLKRDNHDARDYYAHTTQAFSLVQPSTLPTSVDLRPYCSQVEDQGQLGSCTGNALVGAMELLENKYKLNESNETFTDFSRLFVYYNERSFEGTVNQDAGALISDGIKSLYTYGICTETTWPYQAYRFANKPSDDAYTEAATRKISAYARVNRDNGIEGIKQVLASGYPIVFGFMVYDAFESEEVAQTGILNMPTTSEKCQGGHAVLMVGYDDATQRVIVRNSWGNRWGQGGYFTMPYEYIINRNLTSDMWTITK
jgi:C1A family cysteine protease